MRPKAFWGVASWFSSNPVSIIFIGQISIRTSARVLPSPTNSYPENCLWHFAKIAKFLSGQTYGISKNFASFYPVLDTASEGIFRGPPAWYIHSTAAHQCIILIHASSDNGRQTRIISKTRKQHYLRSLLELPRTVAPQFRAWGSMTICQTWQLQTSQGVFSKSQRCRYAPIELVLASCQPNICLGSQVVQDRPYVGLPLLQAILKRGIGHLENKTHLTLNTQNFPGPHILRPTMYGMVYSGWRSVT